MGSRRSPVSGKSAKPMDAMQAFRVRGVASRTKIEIKWDETWFTTLAALDIHVIGTQHEKGKNLESRRRTRLRSCKSSRWWVT